MFDSSKKFIAAAKAGDYDTVYAYLKKYYYKGKVDLNEKDDSGITALSYAARLGHVKMLNRMISFGLDLSIRDNAGHSPLVAAVLNKQTPAALALIEHGANVNDHIDDYIYPLHYAAYNGNVDLAKALIKGGAELNPVITSNGYTPLHWAIYQKQIPLVELLAEAGARTDIPDKNGHTALQAAKDKGDHILKILEKGKQQQAQPAATEAPAPQGEHDERWVRTGANRVSHIGVYPEINRRLTEIFNFESRERTVITENLKTGAETVSTPESFNSIAEDALRKAVEAYRKLGGDVDETAVLGKRPGRNALNL